MSSPHALSSSPGPALPADLAGPVPVMLAKPSEQIPQPQALGGGCQYEPKWDGFRMVVVRAGTRARLWSRQGRELTSRFPEIASAATASIPAGTVVDGEVVIWRNDRLDFSALQRRNVAADRRIAGLVAASPASYVGFDVLAHRWTDVRSRPLRERRRVLAELAGGWEPPMHLTPATTDRDEAVDWFELYRQAGLEGLVVKGLSSRYRPARREWLKVKSRVTTEVIIGGVLGPIERPYGLILGRLQDQDDGSTELVVVGRSAPLNREQAAVLTPLLRPAGEDHPWPERVGSGSFGGGRMSVRQTRVVPDVVAEVLADVALTAGVFRHSVRFVRPRTDLTVADVERMP